MGTSNRLLTPMTTSRESPGMMMKLFSVASWLFPRLMVSCLLLDMTSYQGWRVEIKIAEFRGFPPYLGPGVGSLFAVSRAAETETLGAALSVDLGQPEVSSLTRGAFLPYGRPLTGAGATAVALTHSVPGYHTMT